jgi:ABC transport system ATP-binding/permease protein
MSLITLKNIGVNFVTKPILNDINLQLSKNEKLALIGNNRSGKSTLMKIISKKLEPDQGEVIMTKGVRVKYVAQELTELNSTVEKFIKDDNQDIFQLISEYEKTPNQHLHDILDTKNAFDYQSRLKKMYQDFNLEPNVSKISQLSGGQLKKLQLISALLFGSDLVLLDEPTNHLDIEAIDYLESYINQSKNSFLIISHDRKFLDNICKTFIEIWNKRIYTHTGNYQQFLVSKQARLENESVEEWKIKQYLKREINWVAAGVQARGVKDKGRMGRYTALKERDKPMTNKTVDMVIPEPLHLGTRILDFENFNIIKGDQKVLGPLNLKIEKDYKIGIIGPNGAYKSTFIKAIQNQLPSVFFTTGTMKTGQNTKFLYFEQDKASLNDEELVFNYISEGKERIDFANQGSISTYKYLDNWMFYKDQYNTQIKNLSGGEKSKLLLAKKLLEPTNFLILDEPTNDLDLDTMMLLETNLASYQAPLIIVSHDREFLNHTCNLIMSFEPNNLVISYGNYDDYANKYSNKNQSNHIDESDNTKTKLNSKDIRRLAAQKRELEKQISTLEASIKKIDEDLTIPEIYSDYTKTNELLSKKDRLKLRLSEFENEFLELD